MPFALGIETIGGNFFPLVEKKAELPIKISTKIKTVYNNQPRVHIKFFLGDRHVANFNKFVGEVYLKIMKPDERGQELDLEVRISRAGEMFITLSHFLTKKSVCNIIEY